ncbi:Asp-tRNA(Asn)/Glu-tRNA(Gln) amidotransferase subunit GatA [Mycoplasmoides genitalium]|uniref:Asp-tRNA(Asn)/Glu-tRNA(Gln) amidotransferase subunit GatA n=1 Tax=Mycoplasmoides genitalium TaxID=2097 RepID=UPI00027B387A|nr:Asp-tRNA(Asn)/Glu-tRNA(Gln) amidotransferase subunit GatA [Mycoplasmoides genitalium]AFQ03403.1 aspartyl/glutamyl-tRNA amidotransferase subunit A [Mycoplasmoides genitalium M6282]
MRSNILSLRAILDKKPSAINDVLTSINAKIELNKSSNFLLKNTVEIYSKKINKSDEKILLNNIPYVLKDNIATKDIVTTGGSLFLKNYLPPFSATVFELLEMNGALLVGKANMDEFGLGGTGSYSAFGVVHHPENSSLIAGGSSSGSAYAVAKDIVPFSIATDTGDSIRRPASICNVVGFKPTYGLISRNGVFPYAPSMDHVGIFAKFVSDIAIVSDVVIKHDKTDFSSQKSPDENQFFNELAIPFTRSIRFGYLKPLEKLFNKHLQKKWNNLKKTLEQKNYQLIPLDFDVELLKVIDSIYKIISYSEAVSCYSNLTGIVFGQKVFEPNSPSNFDQTITRNRDQFLGKQLKRRFVIGAFATDEKNFEKYFEKAQKIKRVLVDNFLNLFSDVDFVLSPSASCFASTIEDIQANKPYTNIIDDFLQLANFAGSPSITIPWLVQTKDQTIGLSISANCFEDKKLLQIAYWFEQLFDLNHD